MFSMALFLALSSLLAWSNRRHRHGRHYRTTVAAALLHGEESLSSF